MARPCLKNLPPAATKIVLNSVIIGNLKNETREKGVEGKMKFCIFPREYPPHRVLHIWLRIAWAPGLFVSPFSPFEA